MVSDVSVVTAVFLAANVVVSIGVRNDATNVGRVLTSVGVSYGFRSARSVVIEIFYGPSHIVVAQQIIAAAMQ